MVADEDQGLMQDQQDQEDEQVIGHVHMGAPVVTKTRVGYEEVNMLSELYMDERRYTDAIQLIKTACRRIQGREHETQWNEYVITYSSRDDDMEYEVTSQRGESIKLPIELRVKLGICRLSLDHLSKAQLQFNHLFKMEISDYSDLYFDVGEAYLKKSLYKQASSIFESLCNHEEVFDKFY